MHPCGMNLKIVYLDNVATVISSNLDVRLSWIQASLLHCLKSETFEVVNCNKGNSLHDRLLALLLSDGLDVHELDKVLKLLLCLRQSLLEVLLDCVPAKYAANESPGLDNVSIAIIVLVSEFNHIRNFHDSLWLHFPHVDSFNFAPRVEQQSATPLVDALLLREGVQEAGGVPLLTLSGEGFDHRLLVPVSGCLGAFVASSLADNCEAVLAPQHSPGLWWRGLLKRWADRVCVDQVLGAIEAGHPAPETLAL